ncbi:putative ribosomal protein S6 kinase alpha-1 [Glandiceps talaboti]
MAVEGVLDVNRLIMKYNEYSILKELGRGGFGVVYEVQHRRNGHRYAMKSVVMDFRHLETAEMAWKELVMLMSLGEYKYTVKFIEPCLDVSSNPQRMCLVMELCQGGNLERYVISQPRDDDVYFTFMMQMADAINFLHQNNIVHRDLKPENILLAIEGGKHVVKVGDFGLAKVMGTNRFGLSGFNELAFHTIAGTLPFMAPEVYTGFYTEKADIFSLGLICCAMLERLILDTREGKQLLIFYDFAKGGRLIGAVLHENRQDPDRQLKQSACKNDNIRNLLNTMITRRDDTRPTASEVHDVFYKVVHPKPIVIGEYIVVRRLGSGVFGETFEARHRQGDRLGYTVKAVQLYGDNSEKMVNTAMQELLLLTALKRHNHIVKFTEPFLDSLGSRLCLAMEFCDGGNLEQYVISQPHDHVYFTFMMQIADAIDYLHQNKVVHRDLKPKNILLTCQGTKHIVKVSDFGLAKVMESSGLGPASLFERLYMPSDEETFKALYTAPEVYRRQYTKAADIFSLGVVCCAMMERHILDTTTGKGLFVFYSPSAIISIGQLLHEDSNCSDRELDPSVPCGHNNIRIIINKMMRRSHKKRPTAKQVHSVFKSAIEPKPTLLCRTKKATTVHPEQHQRTSHGVERGAPSRTPWEHDQGQREGRCRGCSVCKEILKLCGLVVCAPCICCCCCCCSESPSIGDDVFGCNCKTFVILLASLCFWTVVGVIMYVPNWPKGNNHISL